MGVPLKPAVWQLSQGTSTCFPSSWKCSQIVVKGGVRPIRRVVAGFAGSSECPVVLVILGVAGIAIRGRAFKASRMAAFAGYIYMFPFELEISQAMVKNGWLPAFGIVAGAALCAEISRMGVIGKMAGFTGGRSVL